MMTNKLITPKYWLLDVDGVLTDGKFHYSNEGKVMKVFGPEDADALSLIKDKLHIHMVTGDKRGFEISRKRIVDDMGFPLDLVSTFERADWIKENFNLDQTIYMGDGMYDILVFKQVFYSIAPANGFYLTKNEACFVTNSSGGSGAVAEAVFHIAEKFFEPINLLTLDFSKHISQAWKGKGQR